jgi:hypothetical protein
LGEQYTNNIVLFQEAIEQVLRLVRILRQHAGHAMLVGMGGIEIDAISNSEHLSKADTSIIKNTCISIKSKDNSINNKAKQNPKQRNSSLKIPFGNKRELVYVRKFFELILNQFQLKIVEFFSLFHFKSFIFSHFHSSFR